VRREAVAALENLPDEEFENGSDLTQAGFVYLMVLQHEHQHNETMLQTLQLMRTQLGYRPEPGIEFPENHSDHSDGEMVFVPGGRFTMGTDEASFAFDNERPAHPRHLPGFSAFPYPEYSEVFFNEDYKVLRGGSWATRPAAIRNTFRNWDHPIRRQLFVGFRCAR
jgi:formylglycine-generating enzyme required for sulfatase activity